MTWLSENPWPLAGTALVLAVVFLMLLRVTQRGRFLVMAGVVLGLGALVMLIEGLWVTDRERLEQIVLDIAEAVEDGDFDRVERHLAPEFEQEVGTITRLAMRAAVTTLDFEFVRIARLEAQAGRHTGQGKADFLAQAQWSRPLPAGGSNFDATPPPGIGFSIGFVEVEPGVWKISRIGVTSVPLGGNPESVNAYLARFSNAEANR